MDKLKGEKTEKYADYYYLQAKAVCLHMANLYLNMLIVDSNIGGRTDDSYIEKE